MKLYNQSIINDKILLATLKKVSYIFQQYGNTTHVVIKVTGDKRTSCIRKQQTKKGTLISTNDVSTKAFPAHFISNRYLKKLTDNESVCVKWIKTDCFWIWWKIPVGLITQFKDKKNIYESAQYVARNSIFELYTALYNGFEIQKGIENFSYTARKERGRKTKIKNRIETNRFKDYIYDNHTNSRYKKSTEKAINDFAINLYDYFRPLDTDVAVTTILCTKCNTLIKEGLTYHDENPYCSSCLNFIVNQIRHRRNK